MSAPDPWDGLLGPLLRAQDPAAARAVLLDKGLPIDLAEAVRALEPDGLPGLGLLVARLRTRRAGGGGGAVIPGGTQGW